MEYVITASIVLFASILLFVEVILIPGLGLTGVLGIMSMIGAVVYSFYFIGISSPPTVTETISSTGSGAENVKI